MKLDSQKRIAAQILKCAPSRIKLDSERLEEIKESITKADIRNLIKDKAISKTPIKGTSRVRANKRLVQRRKGKQKGQATRKGAWRARLPKKKDWMNRIRSQRELLLLLKEKEIIDAKMYRDLYKKAKGGYFRSKRHIKLYLDEQLKK